MSPKKLAIPLVVVGAVVAAIAVMSKPPVLDSKRDQKRISDGLFDQLGIVTESVDCPTGIHLKKGATHTCTARAEGGNIVVKVTQTNDRGNTRWRTVRGVIVSAKIEDLIENRARDLSGKDIDVDCGRRHRVAVVDRTFQCTAEARSGHETSFLVTMNDDRGNVSWQPDLM